MKKMWISMATVMLAGGVFAAQPDVAPPYQPTDAELTSIRAKLDEFQKAYKALPIGRVLTTLEKMEKKIFPVDLNLLPDVEIYGKAADWMLRYPKEEFWTANDVKNTLDTLELGLARIKQVAEGKPAWPAAKGCIVRGYRSRIDGSVQPYALKIPESYDPKKPSRLDVILHGFGPTMNEANFIAQRDTGKPGPAGQDYIRLEVFGRLNNGYRWCGETDVLEAMESVKARYTIDPERIVLRGFSMGGAGAWGMGLHHPDMWVAFEAGGSGAGGSASGFKADAPSSPQDAVGRVYSTIGWMLNAANVPTVGYCGEEDTPFGAVKASREQLESEGYKFTPNGLNWTATDIRCIFLTGPKTEHKWHPDSQAESDKFINEACVKGRQAPPHIRFVSYSLRYNHCFDINVDAVETGYNRTEVDSVTSPDKRQRTLKTKNVARLILPYPVAGQSLTLDGQLFPLPPMRMPGQQQVPAFGARRVAPASPPVPPQILFEKKRSKWESTYVTDAQLLADKTVRKRPGLQGPVNDFLMDSFVCVRPTGTPQHPLANDYGKAAMDRFAKSFSKWLRGDIRIKNDTEVTREDIANSHIVVFGDAGSNKFLAQIANNLPIQWDKISVRVGKKSFDANEHLPAFICPNPFNPRRYLVVNCGDNLLGTRELRKTVALNWLQETDYDVLKLSKESGGEIKGTSVVQGVFDENWKATEK
jgi:dienelactone hydrolase